MRYMQPDFHRPDTRSHGLRTKNEGEETGSKAPGDVPAPRRSNFLKDSKRNLFSSVFKERSRCSAARVSVYTLRDFESCSNTLIRDSNSTTSSEVQTPSDADGHGWTRVKTSIFRHKEKFSCTFLDLKFRSNALIRDYNTAASSDLQKASDRFSDQCFGLAFQEGLRDDRSLVQSHFGLSIRSSRPPFLERHDLPPIR